MIRNKQFCSDECYSKYKSERKKRKRKYLIEQVLLWIAFIIVIIALLFQSYQLYQVRATQTGVLTDLKPVIAQTDQDDTILAKNANLIVCNEYETILGTELYDYVYEVYQMYPVEPDLVFRVMRQESNFNPNVVSDTNDYGLMQINGSNFEWLAADLGVTDLLDPKQNILCGMYMLYCISLNEYDSVHQDLMVYNMGSRGAMRLWDKGIMKSGYSIGVLED